MQASATSSSLIGPWWRVGGAFGIVFVILFFIGGFVMQGETPSRDDSVEEIRQYFSDDGSMYLAGDYILALAFIFFFTPFLVILRWVIGSAEGWPPILSWLTTIGGVMAVVWGGLAGVFWGALALSADNPEVDDSAVRTLMELDTYAFVGLVFPVALFIGSASFAILRTGVLWRWAGAFGLVLAVLLVIGGSWPIDGDDEGALAIPGFIGLGFFMIWVLVISVGLILKREEPAPTERAAG